MFNSKENEALMLGLRNKVGATDKFGKHQEFSLIMLKAKTVDGQTLASGVDIGTMMLKEPDFNNKEEALKLLLSMARDTLDQADFLTFTPNKAFDDMVKAVPDASLEESIDVIGQLSKSCLASLGAVSTQINKMNKTDDTVSMLLETSFENKMAIFGTLEEDGIVDFLSNDTMKGFLMNQILMHNASSVTQNAISKAMH
jgi:hypothetical protein